MKPTDRNVLRVAVLRRLRSVYGIHLNKRISQSFESRRTTACPQIKVFGVPLHHLQMRNMAEYGLVPCFLVDSCEHLLSHAGSEGLFRKSGSIVRLKALRARLDTGEDCISTALPCDVASLVKQFFYELPRPVLPAVLLQALVSAQQLPTQEERHTATQLVSCLLPEINSSVLRFFFIFLKQVSLRALENKMGSYNLSVVFTPNLLHLRSAHEWNDACHRLHIAVIRALIENAYNFGVVPDSIIANSPLHEMGPQDEWTSKGKRCSEVLSLSTTRTPSQKEWILSDDAGDESSRRKRKSFRRSLGMVPSVLFGCCYNSSPKKPEGSPSAVLNRRFSKSSHRGTSGRVCTNVESCVTSREKSPPESPVASCWLQPYQDTPVGLCLKKQCPKLESVSNNLQAIRSAFRTLCCTPATVSPEDQQFVTQDELSPSMCNSNGGSTCLESDMTEGNNTTLNLEEQMTPVVDAGQRQANRENQFVLHVKRSDSKLLGKLTRKLNWLPSSSPLVVPETDPDKSLQDTCGVHLMELSGSKPFNTVTPRTSTVRVVDRVEKYDKLQAKPEGPKAIQSPLKFHRTPVY
ncbi:hypothetical protein NFI96_029867, partial [Prochilodus magdalenae]